MSDCYRLTSYIQYPSKAPYNWYEIKAVPKGVAGDVNIRLHAFYNSYLTCLTSRSFIRL